MLLSIVMQIREFLELVAQLPGWLLYFGAPALLVLAGIVLVLVRAERAYPPVALLLGAVGLVLVAGIAESSSDFVVWAALYAAVAALVRFLFFIPAPKKKQKQDRSEEIYETFHVGLDEEMPAGEELPPALSAEEGELQLAHVDSLIAKLKAAELDAADRLELDAVVRALDLYRGRALTAAEQRALNDCLSAVLKLSAKYSL